MNPYLPLYEYIPDGEPHVFGDRVYIYGSHDRFNGKKFCMNDYVSYSASVNDLSNWRYEGVIYRKDQDIRMRAGEHELWAPDVVRGKDGRYYLYYCPDDSIKSIGVAVCDTPAGKYEFYGVVSDESGKYVGEREGDTIMFDPGVFIDDDGSIYLYSGNGARVKSQIGKEPKASVVMRLKDDMKTIAEEPRKLLPTLGEGEGTGFEGHEMFEASSIRKINGKYYLIYSSVNLHELCYAISDRPDGGYEYGGVVISNAEIFMENKDLVSPHDLNDTHLNSWGNDHGGIECINGEYYIFYHIQTNRSNFSRQGRAEKIIIREDGKIPQVHTTTQGLYGKPLPTPITVSAPCAAVLHGRKPQAIAHPLAMGMRHPFVTQDGDDIDAGEVLSGGKAAPTSYVTNCKDGLVATYRYFDLTVAKRLTVTYRGKANGELTVHIAPMNEMLAKGKTDLTGSDLMKPVGTISLSPSKVWATGETAIAVDAGDYELTLTFRGRGKFDFKEFSIE